MTTKALELHPAPGLEEQGGRSAGRIRHDRHQRPEFHARQQADEPSA